MFCVRNIQFDINRVFILKQKAVIHCCDILQPKINCNIFIAPRNYGLSLLRTLNDGPRPRVSAITRVDCSSLSEPCSKHHLNTLLALISKISIFFFQIFLYIYTFFKKSIVYKHTDLNLDVTFSTSVNANRTASHNLSLFTSNPDASSITVMDQKYKT